jgi:hypothetical protein
MTRKKLISKSQPAQSCFSRIYLSIRVLVVALSFCALDIGTAYSGQGVSELGLTRWRTGDVIISESATDADGWLTVGCQGAGCMRLLDSIDGHLPLDVKRRIDGRLQVRAEPWHNEHFTHFGAFRAADRIGALTPYSYGKPDNEFFSPWLDARYAALECRWRDPDGAHLLVLKGGPTAEYSGADGRTIHLALQSFDMCHHCRGHSFQLLWINPEKPDAERLSQTFTHGMETSPDGLSSMRASVSWERQNTQQMNCTLR